MKRKEESNNNVRKGIIWNSLASFSRYILQFGGVMILARLLTPHDYGVFGLMAIFISIAEVLMDGGLCAAVIKKKDASDVDFSTLAVYNLCAAVLLYMLYYITSPFVEAFYSCPHLASYLRIYSVSIIFHGLVMAPRTYAIKNMKFKVLSLITIVSGFAGLFVAIVMAYFKMGVYSLIGQYVAYSLLYTILIYLKCHYKTKLGFSYSSFKEQFAFGINTTLANALKAISESIYNNVIGKTSQLYQVGYYTQSNRLMQVPVGFFYNLIDTTFFPIMSQVHEKDKFAQSIIRLNTKTLKIIIVLFVIAISMNREIVLILLGEKWKGMEWTFLMLLFSGLAITWGNIGRNLIKCTGKTYLILKYEGIVFVISMVGLFVSAKLGYSYIVACFLLISIIKSVYITLISNNEIGVTFLEVLRPIGKLVIWGMVYLLLCFVFQRDGFVQTLCLKLLFLLLTFGVYVRYFDDGIRNQFKTIIKKI